MATRGRGARRKGANFERWLANTLSEMTGLEAKRGLAQTRGGGAEVSDVSIDYIHVEAKNHIRCNIKAALVQAINDSEQSGKMPVAITKDDRKPVLCTMLLDDWITLFNAYIEKQEGLTQEE
tara:strand:- start:47 stop:412 length:366 start_codon:yes stop_codon:yes gene_type:complete